MIFYFPWALVGSKAGINDIPTLLRWEIPQEHDLLYFYILYTILYSIYNTIKYIIYHSYTLLRSLELVKLGTADGHGASPEFASKLASVIQDGHLDQTLGQGTCCPKTLFCQSGLLFLSQSLKIPCFIICKISLLLTSLSSL